MTNVATDLLRPRIPARNLSITKEIVATAFVNMLHANTISEDFPLIVGSQFASNSYDAAWSDIITILKVTCGINGEFIEIGLQRKSEVVHVSTFIKRVRRQKYLLLPPLNQVFQQSPASSTGDILLKHY